MLVTIFKRGFSRFKGGWLRASVLQLPTGIVNVLLMLGFVTVSVKKLSGSAHGSSVSDFAQTTAGSASSQITPASSLSLGHMLGLGVGVILLTMVSMAVAHLCSVASIRSYVEPDESYKELITAALRTYRSSGRQATYVLAPMFICLVVAMAGLVVHAMWPVSLIALLACVVASIGGTAVWTYTMVVAALGDQSSKPTRAWRAFCADKKLCLGAVVGSSIMYSIVTGVTAGLLPLAVVVAAPASAFMAAVWLESFEETDQGEVSPTDPPASAAVASASAGIAVTGTPMPTGGAATDMGAAAAVEQPTYAATPLTFEAHLAGGQPSGEWVRIPQPGVIGVQIAVTPGAPLDVQLGSSDGRWMNLGDFSDPAYVARVELPAGDYMVCLQDPSGAQRAARVGVWLPAGGQEAAA